MILLRLGPSVADPGCFIPDPGSGSDHCSIPDRIPDPGGKKAPDPGSDLFFTNFVYLSRIPDPTIAPSRIPDPGGKKAPDPGSGSATLFLTQLCQLVLKVQYNDVRDERDTTFLQHKNTAVQLHNIVHLYGSFNNLKGWSHKNLINFIWYYLKACGCGIDGSFFR
jgi:hypothetical protein